MIKLSPKKLTRASALNSIVNVFLLTVIGYFFLDALLFLAPQADLVVGNIFAVTPTTLIGGISALTVSVIAYYFWLEFGLTLLSTSLQKKPWFQKPLLFSSQ